MRALQLPFRLGATSYIIEAGLVENARFLTPVVQDMQLVLFDLPGGPSNLPDPTVVTALAQLQAEQDFSYTIHLIADLPPLTTGAPRPLALDQAQDIILRTAPLQPWAYIAHLDGRTVRNEHSSPHLAAWQKAILPSLARVAEWCGDPVRLAVENLEGYPPGFVQAPVLQAGVGRCVDVGHLWLDGHDPLPYLRQAQPQLRVVHLHGICCDAANPVDHQALHHLPPDRLDPIVAYLLESRYRGVLTLEIFGLTDFIASLDALRASVLRCREP
jgi:sugar phosphate isomerase/epimerase